MKISIQTEDDEFKDYHIDGEVLNGLYITKDVQKLIVNCETFGITVNTPNPASMSQKISVIRTLAILTCKVDNQNQLQYLVGDGLLLPELNSIPKDHMPDEIKTRIVLAYQMANFPKSI